MPFFIEIDCEGNRFERFIFYKRMCQYHHYAPLVTLGPFAQVIDNHHASVPALVIMLCACRYVMISVIPANQSATVILSVKRRRCAVAERHPLLSPR